MFDPRLHKKELKKNIDKKSKDSLVAALNYLGVGNMNNYLKEACVNMLICRIQNLLPDECNFCHELRALFI